MEWDWLALLQVLSWRFLLLEGEGVHLCCSWTGKEKVGFCVREEDRHFVQGEKHVAGH